MKEHFEFVKKPDTDHVINSFLDTEFYKHPRLFRGLKFFYKQSARFCLGDFVTYLDKDTREVCYGRIELLKFEEHENLVSVFLLYVAVCCCMLLYVATWQ